MPEQGPGTSGHARQAALSTIYGIIKAHDGYIDCSSAPGHGATFKVYFPGVKHDELTETAHEPVDVPPGGGETVLVVDDESEIRELTRESLEELGYAVLTAASGEQALEIYRSRGKNIDLVLLDLNMPGMGGHMCLKELREFDPSVRVLISSGYSGPGQAETTVSRGARGYIRKPYSMADLAVTLRAVLEAEP